MASLGPNELIHNGQTNQAMPFAIIDHEAMMTSFNYTYVSPGLTGLIYWHVDIGYPGWVLENIVLIMTKRNMITAAKISEGNTEHGLTVQIPYVIHVYSLL